VHGRTELEVDRPTSGRLNLASVEAAPPVAASKSLVNVTMVAVQPPSTKDRILAALIFGSGIALIISSFLTWVTNPTDASGWSRGDGIATVIAGVVGSSMAGPIFVGFHHTIPKATAIVAGLVSIVVLGRVGLSGNGFGIGAYVGLAAAFVMVLAGAAERGEQEQ